MGYGIFHELLFTIHYTATNTRIYEYIIRNTYSNTFVKEKDTIRSDLKS